MKTLKETKLIQKCKKGDAKAQKELYNRYHLAMFKLCFRYVGHEFDAEDIMISGFVKVFQNIHRYEQRGNATVGAWIKKIMVNEALSHLRSNNNFNMVASTHAEHVEGLDMSPLAALSAEDLYAMIAQMPEGYRTVFNLYVVEGYSHQEIADNLGIGIGTSKSQLSKAKSMLRSLVTKNDLRYGS